MLNRIILGLIVLVSLLWVSYVAFDISSDANIYDPTVLFDENDKELLVVIRPGEVRFDQLEVYEDNACLELASSFPDSSYSRGYFSCARAHFLLENEQSWNQEQIQKLFLGKQLNFDSYGTFTMEGYKGRFLKTKLYVYASEGQLSIRKKKKSSLTFDKKASASLLSFSSTGSIDHYSDIYFKDDGRINYITRDVKIESGNQVKDEELFSGVISSNFESYHFYERDYYATIDKTFREGPMSKWLLKGFVELTFGGDKVLVSDYIGGQDPILNLNDLQQTIDSNQFTTQLTSSFPEQGKSYYLKYLEDLVVISQSEDLCDRMLSDYKLGKTIALNKNVQQQLFSRLPKAVSERNYTKESAYSKSVYQGRLLETHVGELSFSSEESKEETISMSCGFDIRDFAVLPGKGNAIALGTKGEVKCFKNGKEQWTSQVQGKILGELQLIDLHGTGEQFVLLNSSNKVHLWNITGHYETGFPIELDKEASNEVKFYRWKGSSYFLLANHNREILHFDAKGRELRIIKVDMDVNKKIDVWASQSRLFAGFSNDSQFKMYDLEKKRIHREFNIPNTAQSVKIPNELLHFAIESKQLVKYDQKGFKSEFQALSSPHLFNIQGDKSNPIIVVRSNNEVYLHNSEGISFSQILLPFNEIEDIHIQSTNTGKTIIAIIDGLENNVYFYATDGQGLGEKALEGQTKVRLHFTGNSKRVTTIVDQFVIQYFTH